jgi:hypothetical protein
MEARAEKKRRAATGWWMRRQRRADGEAAAKRSEQISAAVLECGEGATARWRAERQRWACRIDVGVGSRAGG